MKNLIPQLEREGGHILILLFVFLICMAITSWCPENALAAKAGDLALGAMLFAMKGNGKISTDQPALPPSEISAAPVAPIVGG